MAGTFADWLRLGLEAKAKADQAQRERAKRLRRKPRSEPVRKLRELVR